MTNEERDKWIAEPSCNIESCPPYSIALQADDGSYVETSVCCKTCRKNRQSFAENGGYDSFSDEERAFIRSAWSDKIGFVGEGGCKLPRKLRPDECLVWNCHDYVFFSTCEWVNGHWSVIMKARQISQLEKE